MPGISTTFPTIICAICDKQVDHIQVHIDACNREYKFKVKCHGEFDYCSVPINYLEENKIPQEGRAFTTMKITNGK